jgi:hypothetical protein
MTCANYKGTMGTFRTICAALLAMGAVCGAAAAHRGGGATARDAAPGLAWTGYGGDPQLTNCHSGTSLEPAEAPSLGLAWQLALDGPVLPATGAQSASWDTVPGPDNMGGVWGWGGVSVEPDGSALYTAVGNSEVLDPSCSCDVDDAGFGDSVVRLTPDLQPVSSDRPKDVPRIDDYDFGAAPTLFRPPGCPPLAAANNKDDVLYVWDRTDLAKGPLYETAIGNVSQPFAGSPSWSPRLNMLFDAGAKVIVNDANTGDGVNAFKVGPNCTFSPAWQTVTGTGTQPAPVVLGDVVFAQGGFAGGYAALDARDGKTLWSFPTTAPTLAPSIAIGNLVVTADSSGTVRVFGPPSLRGASSA